MLIMIMNQEMVHLYLKVPVVQKAPSPSIRIMMIINTIGKILVKSQGFIISTNSVTRCLQDISLSICGWSDNPNEDNFIRHIVSFTDLCNNPSLLESPDLVVRIKDKYYSWRAATPIIISMLVYQRQLPQVLRNFNTFERQDFHDLIQSTVEQLLSMHMPPASIQDKSQKTESRGYSWWSWRRKGDRNASTEIQEAITDKQEDRITPVEEISIKEEISTKTVDTTTYTSDVSPGILL